MTTQLKPWLNEVIIFTTPGGQKLAIEMELSRIENNDEAINPEEIEAQENIFIFMAFGEDGKIRVADYRKPFGCLAYSEIIQKITGDPGTYIHDDNTDDFFNTIMKIVVYHQDSLQALSPVRKINHCSIFSYMDENNQYQIIEPGIANERLSAGLENMMMTPLPSNTEKNFFFAINLRKVNE